MKLLLLLAFIAVFASCTFSDIKAQAFNDEFNCEFDTECTTTTPSLSPYAIAVFPNPCVDEFYIQFKDRKGVEVFIVPPISVIIVDMTGRIQKQITDSVRVDVADLPSGIFTILVKVNDQRFTIKFIKT